MQAVADGRFEGICLFHRSSAVPLQPWDLRTAPGPRRSGPTTGLPTQQPRECSCSERFPSASNRTCWFVRASLLRMFCLDAWMEHTALCTVCTRVSRRCHENPVGTNKKTIRSWGLSRSSNPPCAVLFADGLPGPGQGGAAEGGHAVPPGVGPAPPRPLRQLLCGCAPAAITRLNPKPCRCGPAVIVFLSLLEVMLVRSAVCHGPSSAE